MLLKLALPKKKKKRKEKKSGWGFLIAQGAENLQQPESIALHKTNEHALCWGAGCVSLVDHCSFEYTNIVMIQIKLKILTQMNHWKKDATQP